MPHRRTSRGRRRRPSWDRQTAPGGRRTALCRACRRGRPRRRSRCICRWSRKPSSRRCRAWGRSCGGPACAMPRTSAASPVHCWTIWPPSFSICGRLVGPLKRLLRVEDGYAVVGDGADGVVPEVGAAAAVVDAVLDCERRVAIDGEGVLGVVLVVDVPVARAEGHVGVVGPPAGAGVDHARAGDVVGLGQVGCNRARGPWARCRGIRNAAL